MMVDSDWRGYLAAAHRKLEMAAYHREGLERELNSPTLSGSELPSIGTQAHFEGVVVCVMSAVDQVAQAVNSALRLGLSPNDLVNRAFERIGAMLPEAKTWYDDKIGRDLRRIRTRAVHYCYTKNPTAHRWRVESAGKDVDYGGSRELSEYATAALAYGQQLGAFVGKLTQELAGQVV